MAANCSGVICRCYEAGIYYPDEPPTSRSLLIVAAVHLYAVAVLGTLCNGVAIWCVVTCKKTWQAVKVLLCGVFVPLLVLCLVTQPMKAEMVLAVLTCDPRNTPKIYRVITMIVYSFMIHMELASITALAIIRAVAVWSPQRHEVKLRVALTIVVSILVYSLLMALSGTLGLDYLEAERAQRVLVFVYFLTNMMVPFLMTATSYALMIFAVRKNRRRLAACESKTGSGALLDQATRAILAVFISNMVFGFPHAVFHLFEEPSHTLDLSIHMLFYTHFVVDPLLFIWYNSNYRQQVWRATKAGWNTVICCCKFSPPSDQEASGSSGIKGSHLSLRTDVFLKQSEV